MPSTSNRAPASFIKSVGELETCYNLDWGHDWTPIHTEFLFALKVLGNFGTIPELRMRRSAGISEPLRRLFRDKAPVMELWSRDAERAHCWRCGNRCLRSRWRLRTPTKWPHSGQC